MPKRGDIEGENIDEIVAEYERQDTSHDEGSLDGDNDGQDESNNRSDEAEEEGTKRRINPTAKKRIVTNPIPKLDTERLKGPKGIHTIEKYFEGFKFYGKNRERDDLDRIMKRLEHWSYRLFPKLTFDDFIAKTEKLGAKKDLQTFIKKYRYDMMTSDSDLILPDEIDMEENEGTAPVDAFDLIIAEQIDKRRQALSPQKPAMPSVSFDDVLNMPSNNASSENSTTNVATTSSTNVAHGTGTTSELSEEVKERIERNRQMAIQRRLERLKALEEEAKAKKLHTTDEAVAEQSQNSLTSDQVNTNTNESANVNKTSNNSSSVVTEGSDALDENN